MCVCVCVCVCMCVCSQNPLIRNTEIYTAASILKQREIQVILHGGPSHINFEGNDRADKRANEATSLDVIEYSEHTPGTFSYLVDRFISNQLESIYTNYTSASTDWYQKTTCS